MLLSRGTHLDPVSCVSVSKDIFFPIVNLLLVVDSQSQSLLTIPLVSRVGLVAPCLRCKDREKLTSVPFP